MTPKILISTTLLIVSLPGIADTEMPLSTQQQKFSYAMGVRVVTQLQTKLEQTGMPLDPTTFLQGIQDALSSANPQLSPQEMQAAIQLYQTQQFLKQATLAETNKRVGASFRETNRSSEGVVETTSGLQYRVLREGEGKKPVVTDTVVVGYRGSLVNGEEFDSSHARGEFATVDLNQEELIAGWREALQLMREGAKLELVLPPELAYGARGNSDLGIGPAETLIYEIELISVK